MIKKQLDMLTNELYSVHPTIAAGQSGHISTEIELQPAKSAYFDIVVLGSVKTENACPAAVQRNYNAL